MNIVCCHTFGPPHNLERIEIDAPVPNAEEALVNVSFVSKFRMKLLELIFFTGIKMKAPEITYDSMPKNIEIKKLRETWIKSRKSFEVLVNSLDESILEKGILRHPTAGRIDINITPV